MNHIRRKLVSLTIVIVVLGGSAAAAPADVVPRNAYSYKDGSCTQVADPMSVIFYGTAATTQFLVGYDRGGPFQEDIVGDITAHTGWTRHNTDNLFRQYGPTSTGCTQNPGDTDVASNSGYAHNRYHARIWPVSLNRYPGTNFFVEATPHKEHWVFGDSTNNSNKCGTGPGTGSHAVDRGAVDRSPALYERHGSGFDAARRVIDRTYRHTSRHMITHAYFGNSRSVKQCDAQYAGSNGQGLYILIGRDASVTGE